MTEDDRRKPTKAQLDFVQWLFQETKSDLDWCDFEKMTRRQVQDLIDRLSVDVDIGKWEG